MNETSILITAAGMPRSASTWLYNAIRLLISRQPKLASDFSYGWIGNWDKIPKKGHMLIKVHTFNQNLADASKTVFYSYRDIRDAIASQQRKFGGIASLEWADQYTESHEKWIQAANYTMKYESLLHGKESVILDIANILDSTQIISYDRNDDPINPLNIVNEIEKLNYHSDGNCNNFYNETNLLHKDHITDGRHGAWKGCLSPELVSKITDKYSWWFEKYGYRI